MITAINLLKAFACANAGCQCQNSLKRGKCRTHCPEHSDTNPWLDVTDMDGKVLFMCYDKCVPQATCGVNHAPPVRSASSGTGWA